MITIGFLKQKGNFKCRKNEIADQEKDDIIYCSRPIFQNNKKGIRTKCQYFYNHHHKVELHKGLRLVNAIQVSKH